MPALSAWSARDASAVRGARAPVNDIGAALSALVAVLVPLGVIATGVGVTVTAILSYRGKRAAEQAAKVAVAAAEVADANLIEVNNKIYKLTQEVNGKLTRLLDLTREAALAKGRLEGKAEAIAEIAENGNAAENGGRRAEDAS